MKVVISSEKHLAQLPVFKNKTRFSQVFCQILESRLFPFVSVYVHGKRNNSVQIRHLLVFILNLLTLIQSKQLLLLICMIRIMFASVEKNESILASVEGNSQTVPV